MSKARASEVGWRFLFTNRMVNVGLATRFGGRLQNGTGGGQDKVGCNFLADEFYLQIAYYLHHKKSRKFVLMVIPFWTYVHTILEAS